MKTASILGVHFHAVTMQQAVETAMSRIRARQKGYVVTPNPEIVDLCRRDSEYMGIVNRATLVLPDGIGVIYAAKILGEELCGKVAGIEFAEHLVAAMAKENMRLFLLGAKPGVAEKAGENLNRLLESLEEKGVQISGNHVKIGTQDKTCTASGTLTVIEKNEQKILTEILEQPTEAVMY